MSGFLLQTVTILGCAGMLQDSGIDENAKPYSLQVSSEQSRGLYAPDRLSFSAKGFLSNVKNKQQAEIESSIIKAFKEGHFPKFLTFLQPVTIDAKDKGVSTRVRFWVTPDYLSVGSDENFIRVPMSLGTALQIASMFDAILPTTKMVDEIYKASVASLTPHSLGASPTMASMEQIAEHSATADEQMLAMGVANGRLVAGHKKDLVLTARLLKAPQKIAIYGWHLSYNRPIQPLSVVHRQTYVDYSHGVRLVSRNAEISLDGEPFTAVRLESLLVDPNLSKLISREGAIDILSQRFNLSTVAKR
jgi:hypothetical protein